MRQSEYNAHLALAQAARTRYIPKPHRVVKKSTWWRRLIASLLGV